MHRIHNAHLVTFGSCSPARRRHKHWEEGAMQPDRHCVAKTSSQIVCVFAGIVDPQKAIRSTRAAFLQARRGGEPQTILPD